MAIGESLTRREQTFIGVALMAVLLAAAYWWFMYSPKSDELAALEARLVQLETANQRARSDIAKGSVDKLRAEVAKDARTLEIMRTLVPTSNEVPALLEDISTAARRVGLDLATVEPLPVISGEDFDTYRYRLAVVGSYHAIGEFLSNVGSLRRIVAPVTLEMKPQSAGGRQQQRVRDNPERPRLQMTFQVQTYVSRALPTENVVIADNSTAPGA
ncbi:MAG TPA: type 4a pilus biogenesis protein PilO [Gemmatimonadaceae bacterium]|nr:type 4a pilus biogenesis protein PilO [Gemmatimonadaceae bacterium]